MQKRAVWESSITIVCAGHVGFVGQRGITEDRQSRSRWHSTSPDDTDMYNYTHIWQGQVQVQMAETSTAAAALYLVQHLVRDTSGGGALVGMG